MVSLFIKSFNRAFYLDRCLQSIKCFVEGKYEVVVLDDGTPAKYLKKIQQKHPSIRILNAPYHKQKQNAIKENLKNGKEIDGMHIPTEFWINAVKEGSEFLMMIEDDVWFVEKINLEALQKICKKNNIALLKLGWLGNTTLQATCQTIDLGNAIVAQQPQGLILLPGFLNTWFFTNRFRFFSLLYRLRWVDHTTKQKYWMLNSISMGFWHKNYWLQIWKNAQGKVDEKLQLKNAAHTYKKNRDNPYFICRTKTEILRTTFQSAATNSYHPYGENIDLNYLNGLLNEAWFRGHFQEMQNFPKDFSISYLEKFWDDKISKTAFRSWVEKFKNQYKNLGCQVEA